MRRQPKSSQKIFLEALKDNLILPAKCNLMHYAAYTNNPDLLLESIKAGVPYLIDNFGCSPLQYAIRINSKPCTRILLEYITTNETIFSTLSQAELLKVIECSRQNLGNFFNNAIAQMDFEDSGTLKEEPFIMI